MTKTLADSEPIITLDAETADQLSVRNYIRNTDPKVGDKVCLSQDKSKEVWTVETVMGGRLGDKVGISNGRGESREYYYYCLYVLNR